MKQTLLISFALIFCFYGPLTWGAELVISEHFQDVVLDAQVGESESRSVLDILKDHAQVQTAFGGGYVTTIQVSEKKISETEGMHWFYYVNGIMAHVGAASYQAKERDHIWWDYHNWDGERFVSAVIGAWPEPFLSGYGGRTGETQIWTTAELAQEGQNLKGFLETKGAARVEVFEITDTHKINSAAGFSIYVGAWPALEAHQALHDLFRNGKRVGLFVEFEDGNLVALDWQGAKRNSYAGAGCVLALKSAFGHMQPVWIVSGTHQDAVRSAINILMYHPDRIKNQAGVLVAGEELVNVPVFS